MSSAEKIVIHAGEDLSRVLARLTTKGFLASFGVAAVAALILVKDGVSVRAFLMGGAALLSILALFGYVVLIMRKADTGVAKPGVIPMFVALGGFVPYGFGCYLVLYEGLGGLWRLFDEFAFGAALAAFFYLVAGYLIVMGIYRASEFGRALDEGRISIEKPAT